MRSGLDRLLRPASVAVIGGGTWCANVIEQCQRIGYAGQLWPVHPRRSEVAGVPALPSVELLPAPPDAVFVGVNRRTTLDVVTALSRLGAGGAVCFASGFREAEATTGDGDALQTALLDAAGDMTILGPNCYGFVNYLDGAALWPDQHGGVRAATGVALVTQSSNIAINLTMQRRGVPLAYVVTAGNQAQTGLSEISSALLRDPRVTALGLHIEGVGDLRAFEELAVEAARLNKGIVALKVGASEQARAATISHTASLAGSDAGSSALLKRLGIAQVSSLAALLETLKILHVHGRLDTRKIVSMSCSGGEASLMADLAQPHALRFPALRPDQKMRLSNALGTHVALANPLDYHTDIWGDIDALAETFAAAVDTTDALGVVVLDFPRSDRCSDLAWDPVIEAVGRAQKETGQPIAILASLPDTMPEETADRLIAAGILPLAGMSEALEAISAACLPCLPVSHEPLLRPGPPTASGRLLEADAKAALGKYGVRIPKTFRATSPPNASAAAEKLGYPVALKGEGLAHKTEAGAVALGLTSADRVLDAATSMPVESYIVEEMITGGIAELLIGVVRDEAHGYVLTVGAGGTLTELLQDRVNLLLPVGKADILRALEGLRISRVLEGYRGAAAADLDAVAAAVEAVQAFVVATHPYEVEINPLICRADDAVAVDALINFGPSDARDPD